jgi:hypothetical protein
MFKTSYVKGQRKSAESGQGPPYFQVELTAPISCYISSMDYNIPVPSFINSYLIWLLSAF